MFALLAKVRGPQLKEMSWVELRLVTCFYLPMSPQKKPISSSFSVM